MKQVKIIYEGYGPGFMGKVVDAKTGELIENVTGVDVSIYVGSTPTATIYFGNSHSEVVEYPEMDVTVHAGMVEEAA